MSFVKDKSEIAALLDSPVFTKLLGIQSREQYVTLSQAAAGDLGQYFENPWDDEKDTAGVILTSTGRAGEYGHSIYVAKLYGEHELPFRVVFSEIVPWGNEMDPDFIIGNFKTLGEALDMMIATHEKGDVQLNVIAENEATGLYVKGDASVSVPDAPVPTQGDKVWHALFDKAVTTSAEEWARIPDKLHEEDHGFDDVPVAPRRVRAEESGPSI